MTRFTPAHLGRQHDAVGAQADLAGLLRRAQAGIDQGADRDRVGVERVLAARVRVHVAGEQLLVDAAPVGADAHRLAVLERLLDHDREVLLAGVALADVARIDAVLGEGLRAGGLLPQQLVAVVVEVADQGDGAVHGVEAVADLRDSGGGLGGVDGYADQLGAGVGEVFALDGGGDGVDGVGVGHRLDDRGPAAADGHAADGDGDAAARRLHCCAGTIGRAMRPPAGTRPATLPASWPQAARMSSPRCRRMVATTPRALSSSRKAMTRLRDGAE